MVDASARTVTVKTSHFSDWSLLVGWQLRPPTAIVKVKESIKLSVQYCDIVEEGGLAPLAAECSGSDVAPLLSAWAVNGVAGGSAMTGTLTPDSTSATYAAPAAVPTPDNVAISVTMNLTGPGKELLVSNVTIVDDKKRLPSGLQGTFTYSSAVGSQFRVTGTGQVSFVPWPEQGPYAYRMSDTFTLTELYEDLGDCVCTSSGGTGSLFDQDNGLRYFYDGLEVNSYQFGWSTGGESPASCSKRTPTATCPSTRPFSLSWSLTSVEPDGPCPGTRENTFTNPRDLSGTWSVKCLGDAASSTEESMRWSFAGQ